MKEAFERTQLDTRYTFSLLFKNFAMDSMVNILLGAIVLCILGSMSRINAADELYNPSVEVCCDGKRFSGDYSSSCCRGAPYSYATQVCCYDDSGNESLHPQTFGSDTECCGHSIYNSRTHICHYENDTVKALPSGIGADQAGNYDCCGDGIYDTRIETCCSSGDESVIMKKTNPYMECCNGVMNDTRYSICCNEKVFKSDGCLDCCGDGTYNPDEMICCEGVAFPLKGGKALTACCGPYPYDKKTQLCCNNANITREDLFSKCCGKTTYKSCSELCCGDKVVPRKSFRTDCCGGIPYETDEHICCNQVLSNRKSMKTECCGNSTFEPNHYKCCGGSLVKVNPGNQYWLCCMNSNDNYYSDYDEGDYECKLKGELKENDEESDF